MDLTYKQRLFIEAYLGIANGNASEAARIAGYGSPGIRGFELVKNRKIRKAIDAKLSAVAMPANEVLARLSEIASGSLEHFIDVTAENAWTLSLKQAKKRGKLRLLKKLKQGKDGPEIEIHDPLSALDKLAKIHGLYEQKEETAVDLVGIAREMGAKLRGGGAGVDRPGAEPVPG